MEGGVGVRMAGKALGRKIGASFGNGTVQEAFSPNQPKPHKPKLSNLLSLSPNPSSTRVFASSSSSSPSSPSSSLPVEANPYSYFCDCDACGLKHTVDRGKRDRKEGLCRKCVFGSVPSKGEVEDALSALLQAIAQSQFTDDRSKPSSSDAVTDQIASLESMHRLSSGGSELESTEPALHLHNPIILQSHSHKKVTDAFYLLQSEPSIQRMVVSLSTDKAVWDAVLNNQVVREIRDKLRLAEKESAKNSQRDPGAATSILNWVMQNTMVLVAELIQKIIRLMIEAFQPGEGVKPMSTPIHLLEDALRSSLLLTVVILLIVIVSRANGI